MSGGTIGVTPAVFAEVLRASGMTIQEVNKLPFEERARMVGEARIRLAMHRNGIEQVGRSVDVEILRAERDRRKAEAWAKRQPKK